MWKNSLKNVQSANNKNLYETLFEFLQRNGTYFLNKPRIQANMPISVLHLLIGMTKILKC